MVVGLNQIAAEIRSKNGCGGSNIWGVFPGEVRGNRALPGPSPTANLAGVWKGKRLKFKPPSAGGFLFSTFPAPLERREYDTSRKSNLRK